MKKLGLLLAIFCSLQANGQPFTISFSGTALSTVKVQNLTTGVIVDVPAGDVLHLSTTTDIQEDMELKSPGLNVYPNPMTDKSTLTILPPISGNVIITISDMTGRVLTRFKDYLDNCAQEFSLSDIKNGLYIVNVQGSGYNYSTKILSNGRSNSTSVIARKNNSSKKVTSKKTINDSKGFQNSVDMIYNAGERLKFTAVSGNNSTVMTDVPSTDKTVTFTFTECKDGDDNYYPVVAINTQVWMAENLKTTKYLNGVLIGTTTPASKDISGESTPKYQWAYGGIESNAAIYGRLYTWFAITDSRNVCPSGWHVPTDSEWTSLTSFLGGDDVASGKLKEMGLNHWTSPNSGATNETGFTALPGGSRGYTGTFNYIGVRGEWWSATPSSSTSVWDRYWINSLDLIFRNTFSKVYGISLRCIKD